MTDAEFVAALATETKAIVAAERSERESMAIALRAEIAELKEVILSIPAGKDGKDGRDGVDGKDGIDGRNGVPGEKGMDGKDGRDGRDGKDGIASRDELRAEVDKAVTERVETEVQKRVSEAFEALPVMQYRGVFREGEYRAGDCVTWAGSLWHCNAATTEKPGAGGDWTLAVKKGRDAK